MTSLTSPGLGELKRLINEATVRRRALEYDVKSAEGEGAEAKRRLRSAEQFLVRVFKQGQLPALARAIAEAETKLEMARDELARCSIDVDFAFDEATLDAFSALVGAFSELRSSHRIWDVTGSVATDRIAQRTTATQSVSRELVRFALGRADVVETKQDALHFENKNGGDIYIYPGYAMMRSRGQDFALIEIGELQVTLEATGFIEEEDVPRDGELVGQTWKKANRDGTPDRRFTNNRQIPIVRYGQLWFRSATGLNESYMVSSFAKAERFVVAFKAYQAAVAASAARAKRRREDRETAGESIGLSPLEVPSDEADRANLSRPSAASAYRMPSMIIDYVVIGMVVVAVAAWGGRSAWQVHVEDAALASQGAKAAKVSATSQDSSGSGRPTTEGPPLPAAKPMPSVTSMAVVTGRERVFVQRAAVNVRGEPSSTATIVAVEKLGREFEVHGRQGEWVQVGADRPIGWVHGSLLATSPP